jgi:hypothetical protein
MRSPARHALWCTLLSLAVLPACAESAGPLAGTSTNPTETAAAAGADAGTDAKSSVAARVVLALTANDEEATGAVFDGTTWKLHAFPGEAGAWPSPQVAVAPDGTGFMIKGTGYDKPLRYARWLGGDEWTGFADVPGSQIQGDTYMRDQAGAASVAYRNGLFVVAYNTTGATPVYRTFDPRTATFGPVLELRSGAQKCETHEGVPRDCAIGSSLHLRDSARGPDEVFVSLGELGGYGASFKPALGGPAPILEEILHDWGADVWDSAPMIPDGETAAVQVQFSFSDRFHETLGAAGNGVTTGAAGGCYGYFKLLGRPAATDVSVLCRGARWESMSAQHSYERVFEGHLAGGEVHFGTPIETTLPALASYEYLPGIGADKTYVIGVMDDGQVALFRDLAETPEPFAKGTMVGAAASP